MHYVSEKITLYINLVFKKNFTLYIKIFKVEKLRYFSSNFMKMRTNIGYIISFKWIIFHIIIALAWHHINVQTTSQLTRRHI